jgi:hypothetical protein
MPRPLPLVEPVTMADFPDNMATTLRMRMKCPQQGRSTAGPLVVGRDAELLAPVGDSDVRHFLQTCDSGRCA